MKIIKESGIILSICLLGEVISSFLPIPVPGGILSMTIMLILLFTKVIKESQIENVSNFLLKNMSFAFLPGGIEIMEHFQLLKNNAIKLAILIITTTLITFTVTYFTIDIMMKIKEKGGK